MSKPLRTPAIGEFVRSLGRLVELQEIPQPTLVDYIFEEVGASIRSEVNGKHVDNYASFHELYGEGTAVTNAIAEAKKLHKHFGGALTFVVEKRTSYVRKRPVEGGDRECFYAKDVLHFAPIERGCRWNVPEERVEIVWTSKSESP